MANDTTHDTKTPAGDGAAAPRNPVGAFDPTAMWNAFANPAAAWTAAQTAFQNQMSAAQSAFHNAVNAMSAWSTSPSTNPLAAWTTATAGAHKIAADSFARAQAWSDEYASNEADLTKRAHAAVDTWAQLAHDTINYTAQLSAQARKLSVDAARKAGFAGA
jgi:hypothetical protein